MLFHYNQKYHYCMKLFKEL